MIAKIMPFNNKINFKSAKAPQLSPGEILKQKKVMDTFEKQLDEVLNGESAVQKGTESIVKRVGQLISENFPDIEGKKIGNIIETALDNIGKKRFKKNMEYVKKHPMSKKERAEFLKSFGDGPAWGPEG